MRKLLRKPTLVAVAGLSALLLTLFVYQRSVWAPAGSSDVVQMQIQDKIFVLEVVRTETERQQGLSGRERLNENGGMLFIFDEAGTHCLWMKDMRFKIDMVWLDGDKRVVDIQEVVATESYPESFCPDGPAKYVIELNAGAAHQAEIAIGSELNF